MKAITVANGAYSTYTPGSFVSWTAEAPLDASSLSGDRILAVIGKATGGAPLKPYFLTNLADAAGILQSGELADAVTIAFATTDPITGNRPAAIVAVNVQGGTPATFALKDASAGTVGTLTTLTYREPANQTRIVLTGSQALGYTVSLTDSNTGAVLGANRVGLGLYIQYVGAGKTSTAAVTLTNGLPYLNLTVTGAGAGDSAQIALTGLTVTQLAQKIQAAGPYNVLLARDGRLSAAGLDVATAVSIQGYTALTDTTAAAAAGATSLTVTATARAISAGETFSVRLAGVTVPVRVNTAALVGATTLTVDPLSQAVPSGTTLFESAANPQTVLTATQADLALFFQTRAQAIVTYTPGSSTLAPAAQQGFFSGGLTAAAGVSDWGNALTAALQGYPFAQAIAIQDDRGIAYGLRALMQEQRSVQFSRPTRLFDAMPMSRVPTTETPADIAAYLSDVSNEISNINDRDVSFAAQTLDTVNPSDGLLKQRAPIWTALQAAALRAAVGPNGTTTYVALNGSRPFPNLHTSRDAFVKAGALVVDSAVKGGSARIVLGRTAYVGDDNAIYESEKQVSVMNAITRDLRDLQDAVVPGPATRSRLADFDRMLNDYFTSRVASQWIQAGTGQDGTLIPAFEYKISTTTNQGRRIPIKSFVNPIGEFLVADHQVVARAVEIEV